MCRFLVLLLLVLSPCLATPVPDQVRIVGILRTNDYTVRMDAVRWEFMVGVPIEQMTLGWGGEPGQEDTFQFPELEQQPTSCVITYQVVMPATLPIDPLVFDTWYTILPQAEDSIAPEVLFALEIAGVQESRQTPENRPTVMPNPSGGPVKMILTEPVSKRVSIVGSDGRLVRELDAIGNEVVWDGRDHSGRPVRSGVYYCRVGGAGPTVRFILSVR